MHNRLHKKKINTFFSGILILNDFLMVLFSFILSYWLRFHSGLFYVALGIPSYHEYRMPVITVSLILITMLKRYGLYDPYPSNNFLDLCLKIMKGIVISVLLLMAGTFFYRDVTYSRLLILIISLSLVVMLVASRLLLRKVYKHYVLKKVKKKIILVGRPESLDNIRSNMGYFHKYGYIKGFISTHRVNDQPQGEFACLGSATEFSAIIDRESPDEIILTDLEINKKSVVNFILESEKRLISFKIVAGLLGTMIQQFEMESVDGLNLVRIKESPLNHVHNRILKRLLDITLSSLGLIISFPVLIFIALKIRMDSPGGVFFAQERVSEGGKVFRIFKFRTMMTGAEAKSGPVFTKKDDARCTKFGRFLRKYNLDELPQLWNVFKGEMSLVGPRPERPFFVNQFKDGIPRYMSRHYVKSGITGWAQVNGLRQETPMEERVKFDLFYLENWSLWFDFKILLYSLFAMKNAY